MKAKKLKQKMLACIDDQLNGGAAVFILRRFDKKQLEIIRCFVDSFETKNEKVYGQ